MSESAQSSAKQSDGSADSAAIDEFCDSFENDWRRLKRPSVTQYLEQCDPKLRVALLKELLKIDRHWRLQSANPQSAREDYQELLPAEAAVVGEVWGIDKRDSPSLLGDQSSLGPFQDLKMIGEGGFGVVFRAWDSRHERQVALKIPRFGHQLEAGELARFLREARAAGSLDHPGIARVWDSGRVAGVTYIAYQFVEGDNLRDRLEEITSWPPVEIAGFVRQLASAVQFAHDHDIVHRDIKPSNILLTADHRPVLTDFGLALATSGDATRSLAARVGTLDYMSPEQASGDSAHVDGRADLWSLGVVLFELLSGEKPFQGGSDIELLKAVMQSEPKRLQSAKRKIPRDLEVIVSRCLQKRPDDRLASSRVLASELERVELGKPILSRSVSVLERSLRWCQRNPRPLTAFTLIVLATAFGALSWGGRIADNRESQNLVQGLQIDLETQNAQRRKLIEELLESDIAEADFTEEDLILIESRFLETENEAARLRAAVVLVNQDRFQPDRFRPGSERLGQCLKALEAVLGANASSLKQAQRTALEAAHERLNTTAEI